MDKLVKRVTVVQGSGQNRSANVVYEATRTMTAARTSSNVPFDIS